jgi:hypothetical protein
MERMARAETEFLVKRKPVVEKGDLMTVSENEIVEIVGA